MKNVLIVEDEYITALSVEDYLQQYGFENIVHVASGESAIERCQEINPDLIILDIRLSGQLDGFEVAKKFREIFPETPIIFLTALTTEQTQQTIEQFENAYYLPKPIEMVDLKKMLDEVLAAE